MKPLLTFMLGAYNQEEYVAEAVKSALAQDYSPLQVILSDDHSTDHTFEIIKELAGAYRGPHELVLNQNPSNVGLSEHVNRLSRLAKGELIVDGSGDDIFAPDRTSRLFDAWDDAGRLPTYVFSRMIHIDRAGRVLGSGWQQPGEPTHRSFKKPASPSSYVHSLQPEIFGCVGAYSPSLFSVFGDLPPNLIHEDAVLGLRAVLTGGVLMVDSPLVKYRCHGKNMFNGNHYWCPTTFEAVRAQEARLPLDFANRATMYRAFEADLARASALGILSDTEYAKAAALARQKGERAALESEFFTAGTRRRVQLLAQLTRAGTPPWELKRLLFRLPPSRWFCVAKLIRGHWRARFAPPRYEPMTAES